MTEARISVCLPNFNHSRYLPGAIEALVAQEPPPYEIIIVDDASTDDSLLIIKKLVDRYPIIRLLQNLENQGCCLSTNRAIAASKGDYIYPTAADDLVLPGFFPRALAGFAAHPEAGVCVTGVKYIDGSGKPTTVAGSSKNWGNFRIRGPVSFTFLNRNIVLQRLRRDPRFLHGGPSPIYRREILQKLGGLQEELGPYTDWFNVHAAALGFGMIHIAESLVAFRIAPGGFGDSGAQNPIVALKLWGRVRSKMQSTKYREIFPLDFVKRKEAEFVYYAFAGSMNISQRKNLEALRRVLPPKYWGDRVLLFLFQQLHRLSKVIILSYTRLGIKSIRWSEQERDGY